MPVHKSAKKRVRSNEKNSVVNGNRRSRIRTFIKKILLAVKARDYEAARAAFLNAEPEIQRGVNKGIFHKRTASRLVSRLSARVKNLKIA